MACIAIKNRMTFGEGKEGMIKTGTTPCKSIHRMAIIAIGREIPQNMIGIDRCLIIFIVTMNTFNTERFKTEV